MFANLEVRDNVKILRVKAGKFEIQYFHGLVSRQRCHDFDVGPDDVLLESHIRCHLSVFPNLLGTFRREHDQQKRPQIHCSRLRWWRILFVGDAVSQQTLETSRAQRLVRSGGPSHSPQSVALYIVSLRVCEVLRGHVWLRSLQAHQDSVAHLRANEAMINHNLLKAAREGDVHGIQQAR